MKLGPLPDALEPDFHYALEPEWGFHGVPMARRTRSVMLMVSA
jgi:hypothetical protein